MASIMASISPLCDSLLLYLCSKQETDSVHLHWVWHSWCKVGTHFQGQCTQVAPHTSL